MQLRLSVVLGFLMILHTACNQKSRETVQQIKKDSLQEQTFFPVTDYIMGQLKEIDSLPVTPLKIIDNNGKQDSFWLKRENIRAFAEPFLHPKIDTANFKNLFIEKSFLDQTINAFTFSYDPKDKLPDTLQLRRWDVYVDPKNNTIKRIYIVKEQNNNSTLQTIQLTWQSNKWCKTTTISEQQGRAPDIKEQTMKWGFNE